VSGIVALLATPTLSNGQFENRSWQFQTTGDRANKAVVLDLIERKKGGFYDGFTTVVTNTTNIGTQVNCNNSANATGNIADNGQGGPNTAANGSPNISADSLGNSDTTTALPDGSGSGTSTQSGSQDNSGSIDSAVDGSNIDSSIDGVTNGDTNQALNNDQDNSGNQTAGVDGSTACNLEGSTVNGTVALPNNGQLN
jgi:hypothetical protein